MILRELFYYDQLTTEPVEQKQYDPSEDQSIMNLDDTRKTRLTLKQLNNMRRTAEAREIEQAKEIDFIQTMYGQPAQEEQAL